MRSKFLEDTEKCFFFNCRFTFSQSIASIASNIKQSFGMTMPGIVSPLQKIQTPLLWTSTCIYAISITSFIETALDTVVNAISK